MKAQILNPVVGSSFIATKSINELEKVYNNKPIKKGDIITISNIITNDCFECENIKQAFGLFQLNKYFKPFEC